ncbi:MAG TPA: DUF4097 family beta strand repeat-containing protein [Rhodanobacteraceae bacterium]|nr:DUF4097 family beta strand repeat-containing protein [Rhodanobacteraceae bacterium]
MYRLPITRFIRLHVGAAALLAILASAAAYADTPIHLSRAAAPNAHVVIRNIKGEVRVSGWNQNRVQVDGTLGQGAKPLQISGDANALEIRVEAAGRSGWFGGDSNMDPTVLDVHVPHAAALEVHVVSAPVDVTGMDGRSLGVNTVSGRVHLDARAGAVKVGSVSGDVDFEGATRQLGVETVSGDVQAATLDGSVSAQTVSGDLLLRGNTLDEVNLGTVSGRIQLDAALAPAASWKVDTMSGDVRLGLPGNTSAQIKADTFSGDLHSDFGKPHGSEHGPGEHLGTKTGSGNGSIVINSFSGDVHINRGSR